MSDIDTKIYSAIEKPVTTIGINGSGSRTGSSIRKKGVYDTNYKVFKE